VVPEQTIEFRYRRGGAPPASQIIPVTATWPDLAYQADTHGTAWLRATPRTGRTPRPGAALEFDATGINADPAKLDAGVYEATVTFRAWQCTNTPAVRVRLVVE
jgi:hypothetical protein